MLGLSTRSRLISTCYICLYFKVAIRPIWRRWPPAANRTSESNGVRREWSWLRTSSGVQQRRNRTSNCNLNIQDHSIRLVSHWNRDLAGPGFWDLASHCLLSCRYNCASALNQRSCSKCNLKGILGSTRAWNGAEYTIRWFATANICTLRMKTR